MTIISNEMLDNAEAFIIKWKGTTSERGEAQSFTNDFFKIFGLDRKNLAQFEKPIQKKNESGVGFADLFWSGKLIIESKSAHLDKPKNWEKTLSQAEEYIDNLLPHQKPKFIMLMNFKRIQKYDVSILSTGKVKIKFLTEVPIEDLSKRLNEFAFFLEFASQLETDEEKVNQEAARRIANVYDAIERKGYDSNEISILLARILFCLFAEDTGIFERKQFENYVKNCTGKTLGNKLLELFQVLNTPVKERKKVNPELEKFPYVNGGLFDSKLNKVPHTTDALREALINCCTYDWSDISPVIFGSLFQAVMDNVERRSLGAHYTSEKNILRVLKPLFLDELQTEFENLKSSDTALENFRKKINGLTFLDPACGCGNFLVVAYRELRLLDIEFIRKKYKDGIQYITDSGLINNIHLDNFYGYEIDPTSAMIAEVAMWLTQHQMNMRLESKFGKAIPTIPLHEAANITNKNSLHIEWEGKKKFVKNKGDEKVVFDYIVGNPPFIGKQLQNEQQKKDISRIFEGVKGAGVLDYVACWYIKAAKYMNQHTNTKTALVSTNSIAQGEQTGILWNELFNNYKLKIHFAHQTFKWLNEADGVAGVHCVVIGFGKDNLKDKYIFEYPDIKSEPNKIKVKNINPYLVQGSDITVLKRRKPICNVPEISFGSMPNDGGNLLLTDDEKKELIKNEPEAKKYIKPLISALEFLNGKKRWCIWLENIQPSEIKKINSINKRVLEVKKLRENSNREATKKLASTPWLFGEIRQPKSKYILIPRHSSENRKYIPIDLLDKENIVSDSCLSIDKINLFHFGVLTSKMHMVWVNYVCGRLESRYRYSNEIVYNNFPWPYEVAEKNKDLVEKLAKSIIEIRKKYIEAGNSFADLYGDFMPKDLQKAHNELDKAVDKCYSYSSFQNDSKRMEFLFDLYEKYTGDLFSESKSKKAKK
jgi:type II restriction/modification system DNA methylase subunit YeeA